MRHLYAGQTQTITLLKRGDDQRQGVVTSHKLFRCRRSQYTRTGENIQGEMTADSRTVWHIPGIELKRVGIKYLNSADRIIEDHDQSNQLLTQEFWKHWQPEADVAIATKLHGNEIDIACWLRNPPVITGTGDQQSQGGILLKGSGNGS